MADAAIDRATYSALVETTGDEFVRELARFNETFRGNR